MDWNIAVKYAKLVQLAENVPVTGNDAQLQLLLTNAGYTYLETLWANELSTDIDPHIGEIVSFGFLALSPTQELVASIRGTDTILEWMHDAEFLMVPCPVPSVKGATDDGFTAIYKSLRIGQADGSTSAIAAIRGYLTAGQANTVTVCGHSLGGALATLLTVDVAVNTPCKNPTGYTYASPRTGDHFFAGAYNAAVPASYRVVNRQDLVPQLPPPLPLPYEHVNTPFELNPPPGRIQQTIACMHHLTTYIWLMERQAGTGADQLDTDCAVPPAPSIT
jgi:hypothetical protein